MKVQAAQPLLPSVVATRVLAHRLARALSGLVMLFTTACAIVVGLESDSYDSVVWFLAGPPSALVLGELSKRFFRLVLPLVPSFQQRPLAPGPTAPVGAGGSIQRAPRLERALAVTAWPAIALPLVGAAVAAPLFLHAPFVLYAEPVRELFEWMTISAVIVGHVHVALALFACRFATKLQRDPTLADHAAAEGMRTLGWCTLIACAPGIALLGIPPALVFLTGVVFVPAMWSLVARAHRRELTALDASGY